MKVIAYLFYAIIIVLSIIWLEYCIPNAIGKTIKATRMKNKCICTKQQVETLKWLGATEEVIAASCERITD